MHKVDLNQQIIKDALDVLGYSFLSIAAIGNGAPDAVVGGAGADGNSKNILVEIKNPLRGRVLPDQMAFKDSWMGSPPEICYCVEDVLDAFGFSFTRTNWLQNVRAWMIYDFGDAWFANKKARSVYLLTLRRAISGAAGGSWTNIKSVWREGAELHVEYAEGEG